MAKTIGMIVPPAAGEVPPEPPVLYPDLTFVAEGLALPKLTPNSSILAAISISLVAAGR